MKEAGVIRVSHVYSQPPAKVWRALTEPALVARWWAPGDIRAEVGHRFEMDMGQWGKQRCEVLAVEPERLFRIQFALNTTITWTLVSEGTGTRLELTHEGFDLDSPMGRRAFEGMKPGWPGVLARIAPVAEEL
ncbi:SRPBCC domain-containing protein [Myxococcus faecalis]|uniref:SRPBCC family protein n=1 Tax=Myxococcus TaxID=32 RepID=UPI001CBF9719|nr:SRPBCC domain-containing protein [Myxococcus sp. XM-1-1-1]MBZ4413123.1 SRPBCC domain-containing protein [Myxococcus sp. XM-1-1-1]